MVEVGTKRGRAGVKTMGGASTGVGYLLTAYDRKPTSLRKQKNQNTLKQITVI